MAQQVVRGVVTFAATQTAVRAEFFVHQIHVTHRPVPIAEFRTAAGEKEEVREDSATWHRERDSSITEYGK